MNVKAITAWTVLWFAGALELALVVFVMLGVLAAFGCIPEESVFFNCHFMGNWVCGPDVPSHGFVNLF